MALDKDLIKESLTESEIKLILKDLGSLEPTRDKQGNPIFSTVCHGGNKHKLYYYDDSKMFHCYTDCSCNYDVFELVIKSKKLQGYDLTFPESVKYIANLTGKHYTTNNFNKTNIINDWDWINKFQKKKKIEADLQVFNENVLDVFLPYPHEEWLNEGITYETQRKFEVGYYIKDERIVLPHRSINNELIGIRGRAMNQEDIDNGKKYMPLQVENQMYNHSTMFNLYGLHKTKDAINRLRKVCLFEGEKSVLKCEDFYGDDNFSVAVCSSNITNFHRDIILGLDVEEVFIAFDKFGEKDSQDENKIIEYQKRLIKLAQKFTPYFKVYILWDFDGVLGYKDSPVDKGKDVLEQLMKKKIEIKTINEVEW